MVIAGLPEGLPVHCSSRRPTQIASLALHKQSEETPSCIAPAALQIGHDQSLPISKPSFPVQGLVLGPGAVNPGFGGVGVVTGFGAMGGVGFGGAGGVGVGGAGGVGFGGAGGGGS